MTHHCKAKQIVSEYNKSSKQYKKAFDSVLSGKFRLILVQMRVYQQKINVLLLI